MDIAVVRTRGTPMMYIRDLLEFVNNWDRDRVS